MRYLLTSCFAATVIAMQPVMAAQPPATQRSVAPVVELKAAQPAPAAVHPVNNLAINPFALIYSTVSFSYERVITPSFGVIINPAFMFPGNNGLDFFAVGGALGTRWYVAGDAPSGFFLSPQVEANFYWKSQSGDVTTVAGKTLLGYHWLIGDMVSVHWAGGVQYMALFGSDGSSDRRFHGGVLPTMEVGLGGAF